LELNEDKIKNSAKTIFFSAPMKILLCITIFDFVIALLLNLFTNEPHIFLWGSSLGIVLSLPWELAFLDGLLISGYGFYVIKRKRGEIDISSSSIGPYEIQEISGEAASALGIIYILLGIFLVGAVTARLFIEGIF
jgi:hypothetical protein